MDELKLNVRGAVGRHFDEAQAPPVIRLEVLPKGRLLRSPKGEFAVPEDFNDPLPKEIENLFWG
jgi:hypothetical protein